MRVENKEIKRLTAEERKCWIPIFHCICPTCLYLSMQIDTEQPRDKLLKCSRCHWRIVMQHWYQRTANWTQASVPLVGGSTLQEHSFQEIQANIMIEDRTEVSLKVSSRLGANALSSIHALSWHRPRGRTYAIKRYFCTTSYRQCKIASP